MVNNEDIGIGFPRNNALGSKINNGFEEVEACAMRCRILFVDDEQKVLTGLERMLRRMRKEWEMVFVDSAERAMAELQKAPFDVIVTDMKMPGMEGNQLLSNVKERYPDIVRLVLSGHAEEQNIAESIDVTHQFLTKPCEADELKETLRRCCWLKSRLGDPDLKRIVTRISKLPTLPQLYTEITEALRRDAPIKEIAEIISQDISMTAKILQLVNSPFFGTRYNIANPVQAVNFLGLDTIKNLVFSVELFSQFDEKTLRKFHLGDIWDHSLDVASLAKKIYLAERKDEKGAGHAFLAGMLHDVGKLILVTNFPEEFETAIKKARAEHIPHYMAEAEIIGTTHAEVGSYLLGLWGLPDEIIDPIANHHRPRRSSESAFSALTAVHVANAMVDGDILRMIDSDYLERLGISDCLEQWNNLQ